MNVKKVKDTKEASAKFLNISGHLPVSMSHYKQFESSIRNFDGSDLKEDEFYNVMKIIADMMCDHRSKKYIIKSVKSLLKDSDFVKYRPASWILFAEKAYTFIEDYYAISGYYESFYKTVDWSLL